MADTYLMLAVAILVIVLTIFISRKLKKSLNVILLMGLSDSGKTAIFTSLVFGKTKKSVTSLKENEATVEGLNIRLVDLPGAERLRTRLWEQYRTKACHIMFVVDSSTIANNVISASQYLYTILADEIVYKNKIRVTVVCHKYDLDDRKSAEQIKSLLEKELNAIKDTKKGQLTKTSEEEDSDYLVSRFQKGQISFDSLSINLIETSVNNLDAMIKTIL